VNPITKMLLDMARFYGQDLDKRQLEMYTEIMSQFDQKTVLQAGRDYVRDTKNTRFPMPPHKIMEKYLPKTPDNRDLAIETANRIVQAVGKFGYTNPTDARQYVGEAGWAQVQRSGGWAFLCAELGVSIDKTTFFAQTRDSIQSNLNLGHTGINTDLPAIEQSVKSKVGEIIDNVARVLSIEGQTTKKGEPNGEEN